MRSEYGNGIISEINAQKKRWLSQLDNQELLNYSLTRSQVIASIPQAENRSLVKLLNTTLREGLLTFDPSGHAGDALTERTLYINKKAAFKVTTSRRSLLGGLLTFDQLLRYPPPTKEGALLQVNHPVELVTGLLQERVIPLQTALSLAVNIQESILNDALAVAYRTAWSDRLVSHMTKTQTDSFWQWSQSELSINERSVFFEQWGTTGHPFHPNDKSKQGLSVAEVLSLSPEFEGGASVRLTAIAKPHIYVEAIRPLSVDSWFHEHFPEWMTQWEYQLKSLDFNPDNYYPFPVHPWQAEHILPDMFEHLISRQDLVLLNGPIIETRASMSFRTMMIPGLEKRPHIKLPIALKMTSAKRLLSPRSCEMGPRFSRLLLDLLASDARLGRTLSILPEPLGMHYCSGSEKTDDISANLSVLFRENPQLSCGPEQISLPAASLLAHSPLITGAQLKSQPFIVDIMRFKGIKTPRQVIEYVKQYGRVVLDGTLRLYLQYGIALEAHQQNSLVVFSSDGSPRKIMVRDFGAFRIHRERFENAGLSMKFHHDKRLLSEDLCAVRNKLIHALFISHLGEFVQTLSHHYDILEEALWAVISEVVKEVISELATLIKPEVALMEYQALTQQDWSIKALLRMRLENTSDYIYQRLDNPLAPYEC